MIKTKLIQHACDNMIGNVINMSGVVIISGHGGNQ